MCVCLLREWRRLATQNKLIWLTLMLLCDSQNSKVFVPAPLLELYGDARGKNSGDMLILSLCVDPVMQLTDTSGRIVAWRRWAIRSRAAGGCFGLNNNIDWIRFLEANCRSTPRPFLSSKTGDSLHVTCYYAAWETEIDMKHPHYTLFELRFSLPHVGK